jgi:queuine tRNA-ribosyltransferase
MFDCVIPTRNARHGLLYTWGGIINIRNEKWKDDLSPIDAESRSPASRLHSRAYLRHLILSKEILGAQITTLHNLSFYLDLVARAREAIKRGEFAAWKNDAIPGLERRL